MKKILNPILAFIAIAFVITSCNKDEYIVPGSVVQYPFLMVVNESTESSRITGVSLVGYSFESLNIDVSSSQRFTLDKGMPAGYEDINVIVGFRAQNGSYGTESIVINFYKGEPTTLTLKGCHGAGSCSGFYLEQN